MPEQTILPAHSPTDTRERILAVAEQLFADKGFASTGIDAIARQVGIAKSVIYYHFRNKRAILDAIIEGFIEETISQKREAGGRLQNLMSAAGLDASLHLAIQYMEKRLPVLRILAREALAGRGGSSPLLRFWDNNVGVARELLARLAPHMTGEQTDQYFAEMYFLAFLPMIMFFVFADDWCAHYRVDRARAHEVFVSAFRRFTRDYVIPRLSKQSQ